jgi:uncharacterized protein YbjT (DUF2867 family)
MKKVIVFGASGNVGHNVVKKLVQQNYEVTAVVRTQEKAQQLAELTMNYVIADVLHKETLCGICEGFDIVISTLGKSVSINDKGKSSFYDIDYLGNKYILDEAKKSIVKKFVYLSAIHAEKYQHLLYFQAHHNFSELLKTSDIDYSIVKLPAIFSTFLDVMDLAKKGHLVTLGDGQCKTNPIYEGDVANVIVNAIKTPFSIIEAGGSTVYTRKQINELIQQSVSPTKKVSSCPCVFSGSVTSIYQSF